MVSYAHDHKEPDQIEADEYEREDVQNCDRERKARLSHSQDPLQRAGGSDYSGSSTVRTVRGLRPADHNEENGDCVLACPGNQMIVRCEIDFASGGRGKVDFP